MTGSKSFNMKTHSQTVVIVALIYSDGYSVDSDHHFIYTLY